MNKSTRIMLLLTTLSISDIVLGLNAIAHFEQQLANALVYISCFFVGWTVAELMFWDAKTGAK